MELWIAKEVKRTINMQESAFFHSKIPKKEKCEKKDSPNRLKSSNIKEGRREKKCFLNIETNKTPQIKKLVRFAKHFA